jgi:hypothetical protein
MLARLLKIRAIARAIERHFALFTATLRADLAVHGGTKSLLFTFVTNWTTQSIFLRDRDCLEPIMQNHDYFMKAALLEPTSGQKHSIRAVRRFLVSSNLHHK